MINIPYTGIAPAPNMFPQYPVMPMPVRHSSFAEQSAADILSRPPPRQSDPPNILSRIANGANTTGQLPDPQSPQGPSPLRRREAWH